MKPDYGTLRAVQRTPDGEVVREHEQEVDSYVVGFVKLAAAVWGNQDVSGVTDTDGTSVTLDNGVSANAPWDVSALSTQTFFGLVIGSDGTTETVNDTSLGTPLTTNISFSDTSISTGSVSAPTATIAITRTFTNNTGSTLTINETGLVANHTDTGATGRNILFVRDTGSPIDEVAAGNNTTMEYVLTFEV